MARGFNDFYAGRWHYAGHWKGWFESRACFGPWNCTSDSEGHFGGQKGFGHLEKSRFCASFLNVFQKEQIIINCVFSGFTNYESACCEYIKFWVIIFSDSMNLHFSWITLILNPLAFWIHKSLHVLRIHKYLIWAHKFWIRMFSEYTDESACSEPPNFEFTYSLDTQMNLLDMSTQILNPHILWIHKWICLFWAPKFLIRIFS